MSPFWKSRRDSDDWSARCDRMVRDQIIARGVRDPRVTQAMRRTRRDEFVTPNLREQAYDDCPLPIGFGQTISQPYTVAFMVEALRIEPGDRVLEVGAGSGYAAAILGQLAKEVHSIERIPELARSAMERLCRLGYDNVHIHQSDGTCGLPDHAPYNAIIVAAGSDSLPTPYTTQLAEGGRILIPMGPTRRSQTMHRFTLRNGELVDEALGRFAFVPLVGVHGWAPESP